MSTAIIWFRKDLRCHDNPALSEAIHNHSSIIPLYIHEAQSTPNAQSWWIHHSLLALQKDLQSYHLQLILKKGNPLSIFQHLNKELTINALYWNELYDASSIQCETEIKNYFKDQEIDIQHFNGRLLNEPWSVKNKSGTYFKVFTPYWKQAKQQVQVPHIASLRTDRKTPNISSDDLNTWQLEPDKPNWAVDFSKHWTPGERGAKQKLHHFIKNNLTGYDRNRDYPADNASSFLSPHLHFGEISPWSIWQSIQDIMQDPDCDSRSAERFLSELGWREFSHHLLYHFPKFPEANFREEFNHFAWKKNNSQLKAWQQGLTGYPIVDAGMRQLWHTGFMHNRVRMITASFLTKDLLIDWRIGAEWFLYTLLDGDLANNSAGWQWVAGSGVDASPYFRVFSPVVQGEKFDPQGVYIKTWIPELKQVPQKWIHKPWEAPDTQLGITLGKDYPKPIINHQRARIEALEHYKKIK